VELGPRELGQEAEEGGRRAENERAALAQRTREQEVRLADYAAQQRNHEKRLAEAHEEIRRLQRECDVLEQARAAGLERVQRLTSAYEKERSAFERARATDESELQRLRVEYADVQQALDRDRQRFQQTIERLTGKHAVELSNRDALVAERDRQLNEQQLRHSASE